ncbi:MAG: TIM barrel protein [Verrucomicrobia bacterium]|nr:TIM barrel protein [Verrucomicrobiota bacterium]
MNNPVCVFNKPLQHLSYDEQAKLVAEMGFAGIEGTVRKGGHVEAENVEQDLPRQIEALKKHDVEMTLMTSDINNIDEPINRKVLDTAAKLGVKRFRMRPYKYDYALPIPEQIKNFRHTYQELIKFCADLDIRPLYQNHAGAKYYGASIWDLYLLMKDEPKDQVGMCFDIRHATCEGGLSWPTEFHLMKPWFGMIYCKDFDWDKKKKKPFNVPLGTGMVNYPQFFSMLKKINYSDPISLHIEYIDHRDPKLQQQSIAAIRQDYKTLQTLMKG